MRSNSSRSEERGAWPLSSDRELFAGNGRGPQDLRRPEGKDHLSGQRPTLICSGGGVAAFWKWNERPGQPVVVRGPRRVIHQRKRKEKVVRRRVIDGHPDGVQYSLEFSFAHRALPQSSAHRLKSLLASN